VCAVVVLRVGGGRYRGYALVCGEAACQLKKFSKKTEYAGYHLCPRCYLLNAVPGTALPRHLPSSCLLVADVRLGVVVCGIK
jgi:hypothetical protein